jgi:hypothetical protein
LLETSEQKMTLNPFCLCFTSFGKGPWDLLIRIPQGAFAYLTSSCTYTFNI